MRFGPLNKIEHIFKYNKVAIGSNLEAVIYCYLNDIPLIQVDNKIPFQFEWISGGFDLGKLFLRNKKKILRTNTSDIEVGLSKYEIWNTLLNRLRLSGAAPTLYSDIVEVNFENRKIKAGDAIFEYDELIVFNDIELIGLDYKQIETGNIVLDWFDCRREVRHKYDIWYLEGPLASEVFFHHSNRVKKKSKDLVALSILKKKQLEDYDYSENMCRLKISEEYEKYIGEPEIEFLFREKIPIVHLTLREKYEGIRVEDRHWGAILQEDKRKVNNYIKKIEKWTTKLENSSRRKKPDMEQTLLV